jgi:hypothetical protein
MVRFLFSAVLVGSLASAAVAASKENSARTVDKADKVICRRYVEIGSLVKGIRICKTKREWDLEHENVRAGVLGGGPCASPQGGCQ